MCYRYLSTNSGFGRSPESPRPICPYWNREILTFSKILDSVVITNNFILYCIIFLSTVHLVIVCDKLSYTAYYILITRTTYRHNLAKVENHIFNRMHQFKNAVLQYYGVTFQPLILAAPSCLTKDCSSTLVATIIACDKINQ